MPSRLLPRNLTTHSAAVCAGHFCCVHNPSPHHMRTWPMVWRADRGMMERTCPHGVGHPDPDDVAHHRRAHPDENNFYAVHGCDGCCHPPDMPAPLLRLRLRPVLNSGPTTHEYRKRKKQKPAEEPVSINEADEVRDEEEI